MMNHPKNMTIDAYLRLAGINNRGPLGQKNLAPLVPKSTPPFAAVLATLRTDETQNHPASSGGSTITDYLTRRTPSAESALFRFSTLQNHRLTGSVQDRHHFMPVLTVPKPISESATTEKKSATLTDSTSPAEADTEKLIGRSIKAAAEKYNLSAALIRNVIRAESNFQPDAVSPAGAQGLMQLMPATARELGVTDPFDVKQNIDGGARYIRQMLDRFDGNIKLALAAYNAGPGTVMRYGGEVPPYPETQKYLQRVLSDLNPPTLPVA